MNLVAAFVKHPVKVTVGVLLLSLFGALALARMPMQLVPEVQTPTITIETRWPSLRAASRVASLRPRSASKAVMARRQNSSIIQRVFSLAASLRFSRCISSAALL